MSRLLEDYRRSFVGADVVIIGPIEEARERGMPKTVSSQDVADRAGPEHAVHVVGSSDAAVDLVTRMLAPAMCSWCCPSAASTSWRLAFAMPWRRRVSAGDWLDTFPACIVTSRSLATVNSVSAVPRAGSSPPEMSRPRGAASPLR